MEYGNREPRGRNPKPFNASKPQDEVKQPMAWQNRPLCRTCGRSYAGHELWNHYDVTDVERWDIK